MVLQNCLQCFSSENVLIKRKKVCLIIIGLQSIKLEEAIVKFQNYCKQIHCPFRTYVNFESNLVGVEVFEDSCLKNIKTTILAVLLTKLFVFTIKLVSQLLFLG